MAKGDEELAAALRQQAMFIGHEAAQLAQAIDDLGPDFDLSGGKEGPLPLLLQYTAGMKASLAAAGAWLKLRMQRQVPNLQQALPGMGIVDEAVRRMHRSAVSQGLSMTLTTSRGESAHLGIPEDEARQAEEDARSRRGVEV